MTTAIAKVLQQSETIINDAPRTFDAAAWSGKVTAHQGDLCIVRLGQLPPSAKPRTDRKLAIGDTQGSRHMLVGGAAYDCDAKNLVKIIKAIYGVTVRRDCIGPVFTGPATLEHPEHGDHIYDCECVNAVVYQRSLDSEERETRVAD